MSEPLVSVVLPTRNRAGLLPRAIDSVLGQTFTKFELIVVDNASEDGTQALLGAIDDPRLVSIRLDYDHGAAGARNTGIRAARAPLLAFQDSDDEWLPTKLEHQLALLEACGPKLGAVGGRYLIEAGGDYIRVGSPRLETGSDYEVDVLAGPCFITPAWLIRRSLLDACGGFDEDIASLEDWDLMLRLSARAELRSVPSEVLIKHGAPDSLGGNLPLRAAAMAEILRRNAARFRARPRRYASYCLELSYMYLVLDRRREAFRYAALALSGGGASPRLVASFVRACVRFRRSGHVGWPPLGLVLGDAALRD